MLGYLKGKILENSDGKLIVITGAPDADSAVGYAVTVPAGASYLDFQPGSVHELFLYTHVREDSLDLYGFRTRSEKELFLTLLNVNGIGPKVGMSILSSTDPASLLEAILEGDKASLTRIPGIGKKTAERVVLELADPLRKRVEQGGFREWMHKGSGAVSAKGITSAKATGEKPSNLSSVGVYREATDALIGLGYREIDIQFVFKKIREEKEKANDFTPPRLELIIRTALQQLSQRSIPPRSLNDVGN